MTAELSSAMPVNGGYIVWLETAFGPFWGFQMVRAAVTSDNLIDCESYQLDLS